MGMNLQIIIRSCIRHPENTIVYLHNLFQLMKIIIIASCPGQHFGQGRIITVASIKQETLFQSCHNADIHIISWDPGLGTGFPENHRKVDQTHIPCLSFSPIKNIFGQIFKIVNF